MGVHGLWIRSSTSTDLPTITSRLVGVGASSSVQDYRVEVEQWTARVGREKLLHKVSFGAQEQWVIFANAMLETDIEGFDAIMMGMKHFVKKISLEITGQRIVFGDFVVCLGKLSYGNQQNPITVIDVEYKPCVSVLKGLELIRSFKNDFLSAFDGSSQAPFSEIPLPPYSEFGLGNDFSVSHLALGYSHLLSVLVVRR
jgi:hypothetical protein